MFGWLFGNKKPPAPKPKTYPDCLGDDTGDNPNAQNADGTAEAEKAKGYKFVVTIRDWDNTPLGGGSYLIKDLGPDLDRVQAIYGCTKHDLLL